MLEWAGDEAGQIIVQDFGKADTMSNETLEAVRAAMNEAKIVIHEEESRIVMHMGDRANGSWTAYLFERNECFICSSVFPVLAPEERRVAVAELLARINWALIIGNFELDFSDGEVRYKTSAFVRADKLTPATARDLCFTNFSSLNRYWQAILAVSHAGKSAEEALSEMEEKSRRERAEFNSVLEKMGVDPENPEGRSE
jgi:hypothetical protein